jgi:hypothetical protein
MGDQRSTPETAPRSESGRQLRAWHCWQPVSKLHLREVDHSPERPGPCVVGIGRAWSLCWQVSACGFCRRSLVWCWATPWLATLTQTVHHAAAGIASGWRDGSAAACSLGRSCGGEGRLPPGPLLCQHCAFLLSSAGYVTCPVQRWMSSAAALAQPLEDLPPYASNVRRRGF